MKFNYVIIYVDDVVQATKFYEAAFGMTTQFVHESNMYAEMSTGETTLAFASGDMLEMNTGIEAPKGPKNCFEIALSTGDVQKSFENALKKGATEVKKPETKPWGQTVAYVRDPFGTLVEICTPME
jgi:lactoylglutathione lyase